MSSIEYYALAVLICALGISIAENPWHSFYFSLVGTLSAIAGLAVLLGLAGGT